MFFRFLLKPAVSALTVFLFFQCWLVPVLAESTPAFWKVQSKTASVYLLGSMHFGAEDFYPLPEVVTEAFEASQILVVEVDITNIKPADAIASIMRHGRLGKGQSLHKVLQPKTYALLQQQTEAMGIPLDALDQFQPWFAAIQLVEAELKKTSFKQQYGIDQYFLQRAEHRSIHQLETLDSQLGMFAQLSFAQQDLFLYQTLVDFKQSQHYLNELAKHWQEGDIEALETSLLRPFREQPESESLYNVVFTDRNAKMHAEVERYLLGSRTVFFVVGAGHMIGDDGIIARLRQRGHEPKLLSPARQ